LDLRCHLPSENRRRVEMMQEHCLDTHSHQECIGSQLAAEEIPETTVMTVVVGVVAAVALDVVIF
ncbi:unnamed protein product, partial [Arabidopsis halleri]